MERAVFDETPDHIVHLGDHIRDGEELAARFPRIPMTLLPGNCDLGSPEPKILTPVLGGVPCLLTHGHTLGVKYDLTRLWYAAREAGARLALFGHTHRAVIEEMEGVTLMNPGAAGGSGPSYGVVEIGENGTRSCRIVRL